MENSYFVDTFEGGDKILNNARSVKLINDQHSGNSLNRKHLFINWSINKYSIN